MLVVTKSVRYRVEQKNLAKFSDTCSVRADGLCIGSPRLVGGRKAGNSNVQEFFCTSLYFLECLKASFFMQTCLARCSHSRVNTSSLLDARIHY